MSDPVKEAVERLETAPLYSQDADGNTYRLIPTAARDVVLSELSRLSRLVEEAGEALEPFKKVYAASERDFGLDFPGTERSPRADDRIAWGFNHADITWGDFRRASLAHKAISGGGE